MRPTGSSALSQQDSLPLDGLTGAASKTCSHMNSTATANIISSPVSADGRSPFASPGGPTTRRSGQGLAPANRSRAPRAGGVSAPIANGTFGQYGASSLLQGALASSLASRLPKLQIGMPQRAMTWRQMVMPSGRLTCRLSASVAIIRASGFIIRATPTAKANQSAPSMAKWPGCKGIEVSPQAWCERMGYPLAWLQCAGSETQSTRKSPRRSSPRATKR